MWVKITASIPFITSSTGIGKSTNGFLFNLFDCNFANSNPGYSPFGANKGSTRRVNPPYFINPVALRMC